MLDERNVRASGGKGIYRGERAGRSRISQSQTESIHTLAAMEMKIQARLNLNFARSEARRLKARE
jgi:hypothetical protein